MSWKRGTEGRSGTLPGGMYSGKDRELKLHAWTCDP